MNWLLILVILVIAANIVIGYRKGFLRVAYSLVEWVLILVFINWASPYVTDFLVTQTGISERLEAHCTEQIRQSMEEALGNGIQEELGVQGEEGAQENLTETQLEELGVRLPAALFGAVLEKSGAYSKLAEQVTNLAMRGISYMLTLIVALLLFYWLRKALHLIDKIPILNGVNRLIGTVAGLIKGLFLTWIGFALVAAFAGTVWGKFLISYIYEAPILTWLYDNNIILTIILSFT
jgi:uncharacterized membrane protein required for colicin V production